MRFGLGFIALIVVCSLTACTSSAAAPAQMKITSVQSHDVQLLTYEIFGGDAGVAEAAFEGNFIVDDSACLALVSGDQQIGVVLPKGTTIAEDKSLVVLPDASPLSAEGQVRLGGGYYSPEQLPAWESEGSCKYDEYFVVSSTA